MWRDEYSGFAAIEGFRHTSDIGSDHRAARLPRLRENEAEGLLVGGQHEDIGLLIVRPGIRHESDKVYARMAKAQPRLRLEFAALRAVAYNIHVHVQVTSRHQIKRLDQIRYSFPPIQPGNRDDRGVLQSQCGC